MSKYNANLHSGRTMKYVLFVDDDPMSLNIAEEGFENEKDIHLFRCTDLVEAKHLLESHKIDGIILDWILEETTGIEFTMQLRRHRRFKTVPIIIASGRAMEKDREIALKAGATDYFSKPYELEDLIDRIKELMGE